jgi:hypothetical protein
MMNTHADARRNKLRGDSRALQSVERGAGVVAVTFTAGWFMDSTHEANKIVSHEIVGMERT